MTQFNNPQLYINEDSNIPFEISDSDIFSMNNIPHIERDTIYNLANWNRTMVQSRRNHLNRVDQTLNYVQLERNSLGIVDPIPSILHTIRTTQNTIHTITLSVGVLSRNITDVQTDISSLQSTIQVQAEIIECLWTAQPT